MLAGAEGQRLDPLRRLAAAGRDHARTVAQEQVPRWGLRSCGAPIVAGQDLLTALEYGGNASLGRRPAMPPE